LVTAFYNYALNMKLTKPFLIRAPETCATLDVDLNMVEKARREQHSPWIGDSMEDIIIITRMTAVSKGAGTAIGLAEQTFIINAEAQAIIEATRRWGKVKRIVITDSLSNVIAEETLYTKGNSKKTELKDLLAEEGSNLRLMWVPSHMGITGNECAHKAAKNALDQNVETTTKVVKSDYCKWVKEKAGRGGTTNGGAPQAVWLQ
jgi:ribonuclease HI